MKKLITALFFSVIGGSVFGQWSPATPKKSVNKELSEFRSYYTLDLSQIKEKLKNAQEMGANSKPVEISIPTQW